MFATAVLAVGDPIGDGESTAVNYFFAKSILKNPVKQFVAT